MNQTTAVVSSMITSVVVAVALLVGAFILRGSLSQTAKASIYSACASNHQVAYNDGNGSVITTPIEDKVADCVESFK